jgi:protoheme IX farnesyltransferase
MEKSAKLIASDLLKHYLLLTKPGIIVGNLLTAGGGFLLASKGNAQLSTFFSMLEGLVLIIGAACIANNVIDKEADKAMARTKNRALPTGIVPKKHALTIAILMGVAGSLILGLMTNALTLILALSGLLSYVFVYSFAKYKTHYGTLIGSIAGAIPPVVGYTAASECLDLPALILYLILVFWQMPHFYAISIFRASDYKNAAIPVLPLAKGMLHTKLQMIFYSLAFLLVSLTLALIDGAGPLYFIIMSLGGFAWLILSIKGLTALNDRKWARQMFFTSLLLILLFSSSISLAL